MRHKNGAAFKRFYKNSRGKCGPSQGGGRLGETAKSFFHSILTEPIQFVVDAALAFGHVKSLYSHGCAIRAPRTLTKFSARAIGGTYERYFRPSNFPA